MDAVYSNNVDLQYELDRAKQSSRGRNGISVKELT